MSQRTIWYVPRKISFVQICSLNLDLCCSCSPDFPSSSDWIYCHLTYFAHQVPAHLHRNRPYRIFAFVSTFSCLLHYLSMANAKHNHRGKLKKKVCHCKPQCGRLLVYRSRLRHYKALTQAERPLRRESESPTEITDVETEVAGAGSGVRSNFEDAIKNSSSS